MIDRWKFAKELEDPAVARKFYAMMQSEVGGQGPEAQTAWAETVFNRAAANGVSVDKIISNRRYYEPYQNGSFYRNYRGLNSDRISKLGGPTQRALEGSDLTRGATHNASAGVARSVYRGGYDADPRTITTVGGETFYGKHFPKERQFRSSYAQSNAPNYAPLPEPNPAYAPGKDYTQTNDLVMRPLPPNTKPEDLYQSDMRSYPSLNADIQAQPLNDLSLGTQSAPQPLPPVEVEQYVNRGPRGDYGPPMVRGATVTNPTPATSAPQMPTQPDMPLPGISPFRNTPRPPAPTRNPYANALAPKVNWTPADMITGQLSNNLFKFW